MIEPLLWEEFNSYYKFMYTDENNKKNKNDLPLSPFHFSYSFSTLFRMRGGGGGQKSCPTSVSAVTSTNVGTNPKNFLTFSISPFSTLVWIFKVIPNASPKLLNLNQDHPSKKCFFWSNPYKIEGMITSLTEMLEVPNFGHMTTSII